MSDELYRDHGIGLLIRLLALADALAAAVEARQETVTMSVESQRHECPWCGMSISSSPVSSSFQSAGFRAVIHAPDCPLPKARAYRAARQP